MRHRPSFVAADGAAELSSPAVANWNSPPIRKHDLDQVGLRSAATHTKSPLGTRQRWSRTAIYLSSIPTPRFCEPGSELRGREAITCDRARRNLLSLLSPLLLEAVSGDRINRTRAALAANGTRVSRQFSAIRPLVSPPSSGDRISFRAPALSSRQFVGDLEHSLRWI